MARKWVCEECGHDEFVADQCKQCGNRTLVAEGTGVVFNGRSSMSLGNSSDWRVAIQRGRYNGQAVVYRTGQIAEMAVYPNRYKQTLRRRLWNFLRGKGSTERWIDTDFNAIGQAMADKYGLRWEPWQQSEARQ